MRVHATSKTIRVSEEFHALVKAHERDGETMRMAVDRASERAAESSRETGDRFERSSTRRF